MEFTQKQQKAISLRGDSLLVSAAAGSGKTTVLTERVVRRLCDQNDPCTADRLMILTFGNAAAAHMRAKITEAMLERVAKEPENRYIRDQLSLLPAATIGTVHSACFDIIRSNFEQLGIDPQFSVAEEAQLEIIRNDVTDDFVEQLYNRAKTERDINELIDYYVTGRDDKGLVAALTRGCAFLENEPFCEQYISRFTEYDENEYTSGVFGALIKDGLCEISEGYAHLAKVASSHGFQKLCDYFNHCADSIGGIYSDDWDAARAAALNMSFGTRPSVKKNDPELNALFGEKHTFYKKRFEILRGEIFICDKKTLDADRRAELKIIRLTLELCLQLNERLADYRREHALVSFADAERYALRLLVRPTEDGFEKTELALRIGERYEEIIVDEYQDSSKIQNCIFEALSKQGKNIFMVGDIKQSIYRFRNACPALFLKRQQNAIKPQGDTLTAPAALDLSSNFRSHRKIIDFVNRVFEPIMTKDTGGVDYADGHRLESIDRVGEPDAVVSLTVVEPAEGDSSYVEAEARFVAKKIKEIIGKLEIYDSAAAGGVRTVRADDIAVVMHSPGTIGAIFEKALTDEGVGCLNSNTGQRFIDSVEVLDVIAYLQAVNNPYDDIPLIALMYSDYFGFTANELAKMRRDAPDMPFFDAVCKCEDKKARDFVQTLEYMRSLSTVAGVYEIINTIYEQSGVLLRCGGTEKGRLARENLMLLLDFAAGFESERYLGLYAFVKYIERVAQSDREMPSARLVGKGGSVSLMSIHRSKGLEFPVLFLVGCSDRRRSFSAGDVIFDSDMGVGGYIRDRKNHREFKSPACLLLEKRARDEEMYEYMRTLYVALTRAKSHLFITAAATGDALAAAGLSDIVEGRPSRIDIIQYQNYWSWMMYGISSLPCAGIFRGAPPSDTPFSIELWQDGGKEEREPEKQANELIKIDKSTLKAALSRKYAYEQSTQVPVKLSVSEIKRKSTENTPQKTPPRPRFMKGGVSGADRGDATHRFLQFCDFFAITDTESFNAELSRLKAREFLSERECSLVDGERILAFLQSDIMKELCRAGVCRKEQRFLFTLPAREAAGIDSDEPVIVQGVIDCWFECGNTAVIVDYKTDIVKDESELSARYGVQLELYGNAVERLTGLAVKHRYIYSFHLERFIEI